MSDLLLPSLEITNFRVFKHLQIENLGRVNLFVGKNNVGKSSVLEALRIYAHRAHPNLLWELLEARSELRRPMQTAPTPNSTDLLQSMRYLFHGRGDIRTSTETINIGPVGDYEKTLQFSVDWLGKISNGEDAGSLRVLSRNEIIAVPNPTPILHVYLGSTFIGAYILQAEVSYWAGLFPQNYPVPSLETQGLHSMFVSSEGLDPRQVGKLWDAIALTTHETDVTSALRLIVPSIERVSLIGEQEGNQFRTPVVKMAELDRPIPLGNLGEGLNRMFGMVLALTNAQGSICLIDEIESGLHYSVQLDMWRLIFDIARRLNIQVFATTHSWDCIKAFQQAAEEDIEEQGVLIRLQRRQDEIVPVHFDEQKLEIMTSERIEVR